MLNPRCCHPSLLAVVATLALAAGPALAEGGAEANDQSCANIPGPGCGGEGYSPTPGPDDEGFVHVGNGFHELGDTDADGFEVLGPATYDWRNPVARITITARRGDDPGDDPGDH